MTSFDGVLRFLNPSAGSKHTMTRHSTSWCLSSTCQQRAAAPKAGNRFQGRQGPPEVAPSVTIPQKKQPPDRATAAPACPPRYSASASVRSNKQPGSHTRSDDKFYGWPNHIFCDIAGCGWHSFAIWAIPSLSEKWGLSPGSWGLLEETRCWSRWSSCCCSQTLAAWFCLSVKRQQ